MPSTPRSPTAFTLQVVEPHLNGPGGDVPVIVYDVQTRQDGSDLRPGRRAGRRHHRALPQRRPRPRARHRAACRLRARHLRDLDDAAARLRHHVGRRRAGAGHRLRAERLSTARAHQCHHLDRRRPVPRILADLGRGVSAGQQGAGDRIAVHQQDARRHLYPHRQGSRKRRRRPRRADRACAKNLVARVLSPKRSTASAGRRRSWTPAATSIAAC